MTVKTARRLSYTLVLLFACNLLYFLFPFPPLVWRVALVIIDIYIIARLAKFGLTNVEKSILWFVILVSAYFFIGFMDHDYAFTNLGNMYVGMLSFPAFSCLARRGAIDENFIQNSTIILIVACIPYYYHEQIITLQSLSSKGMDVDVTTVNASVVFTMLLPSCLLIRNQKLIISVVCVALFFLLDSSKRGNIVAAIIPLTFILLHIYQRNRKSFFKILLMLIVVSVVGWWVSNLIMNNEYLLQRYTQTLQGHSSGRDHIYNTMWELWYDRSDTLEQIFGLGYNGTILYGGLGKYAHNDWLEILVDFGLIGVILYASIVFQLLLYTKKIQKTQFKEVILSIFAIWLIKSIISMGFTGETMFLMALPFAYVIGQHYLSKTLKY